MSSSNLYVELGSAPNTGTFLIWAPLISVPYVTYDTEVRRVFCAPAMPKSSEHILTSISLINLNFCKKDGSMKLSFWLFC